MLSTQDASGNIRYVRGNVATVFANPRHIGLEAWAVARTHNLHADYAIQVRSMEYKGQQRCEIDGQLFEVERSYDLGEYSTLTLKQRLEGEEDGEG